MMPGEVWGRKDDADKVRMELLPPELLEGVGKVLTFGAKKYSDRNWEAGIVWSRVYGAALRHMNAWWSGEANDPETGMSHLWHLGCCVSFLIAFEQRGIGPDDRPSSQKQALAEWEFNHQPLEGDGTAPVDTDTEN